MTYRQLYLKIRKDFRARGVKFGSIVSKTKGGDFNMCTGEVRINTKYQDDLGKLVVLCHELGHYIDWQNGQLKPGLVYVTCSDYRVNAENTANFYAIELLKQYAEPFTVYAVKKELEERQESNLNYARKKFAS